MSISIKLKDLRNIEVSLDGKSLQNTSFSLFVDNENANCFSIKGNLVILNKNYDFNKEYKFKINNEFYFLDFSEFVSSDEFDSLFYYDGDDLGATYTNEETTFKVWSPTSHQVFLKLEEINGNFSLVKMKRENFGVFAVTIKGDLLNRKYHYVVRNGGKEIETNDPYGKGVSLNSEFSAVVDINRLLKDQVKPTLKLNNYVDSIIYETNIRDFTENNWTNISQKGKYGGFVESGKITKGGNPAGLDYLKYLGVTHVQLNPITDFANVDDLKINTYNWGYDPLSYFALEGSYSSFPDNPSSRLLEFKELVDTLHIENIRVICDMVYNHVFKFEDSYLEKLVPGYYFRKQKDGTISNCSGCGNDLATERPMVRKLIIDSAKYFVKYFDIDGIRFDLMGLLDVDTINLLIKECKLIKNDLMFYGEGWNLGGTLSESKRGTTENCKKLHNVGFFNDTYRDVIKGPIFDDKLHEKGYVNGDICYAFGLDYIFFASVKNISYDPKFLDANQSINFAECHDNQTIFDKLLESNKEEETDTLLKRVNLANDILLASYGVPFIHEGQEIGQSKDGYPNTYNVKKINSLKWELVDERFEMVRHFRKHVEIRRILNYTKLHSLNDLENSFDIVHHENGLYTLKSLNENVAKPFKEILIIFNPLDRMKTLDLKSDYLMIDYFLNNNSEKTYIRNCSMPAISSKIFYKI